MIAVNESLPSSAVDSLGGLEFIAVHSPSNIWTRVKSSLDEAVEAAKEIGPVIAMIAGMISGGGGDPE